MELEFTTDQDELRAGIQAMLEREATPSMLRELVSRRAEDPAATSESLWRHMVELGWPGLTVPESAGGIGLGAVELIVLAEELGRVIAPGPLLPTVSQFVAAVVEAGDPDQQTRLLEPVAISGATGSLAVFERGAEDPGLVTATATPTADGFTLDGKKPWVLEGPSVDRLVVVARIPGSTGDEGVGAFVVDTDAPGVSVDAIRDFDLTRTAATVTLAAVSVATADTLGRPGPAVAAAIRRAIETATVALAVETVGVVQKIFDVTLEYAKEREQFGVPIGSFQAIKHKFADMAIIIERARATGYFAALTIAEDDERRAMAISMAKAAAGDAAALVAKEGIQIHGGIGYTWEHDMHVYVRRAKANAAMFGTAATHRARVADQLFA